MTDYSNIKVPEDMVDDIKKIMENHPEFGYRNPSEFVIEATRKQLIKLKELISKNEYR